MHGNQHAVYLRSQADMKGAPNKGMRARRRIAIRPFNLTYIKRGIPPLALFPLSLTIVDIAIKRIANKAKHVKPAERKHRHPARICRPVAGHS